jgi:uncharacterized repeat protein (TIGR03803 family)
MGRILAILAIGTMMALAGGARAARREHVIYGFSGNRDGGYPDGDLVVDSAGNIYGTTVEGGKFDSGAVFKLTPSGNSWAETVLYSFTSGADGGQPYGGVTLDARGNLYGTAVIGGDFTGENCVEDGCGVVFKLTHSGGKWTETVIHSFTGGSDGYGPGSGLTFDQQGNLYGMTPTGGADGFGDIYQLSPGQNVKWRLKVIHTFTGGEDGGTGSAGRLIFDGAGNLYGVATVGGANGAGTAYKLTLNSDGKWRLKTLYAFKGEPDAGFPYGGLVLDASGNLYGTSYYDGANDVGAVYRLARRNGVWTETVLYSFKGNEDGSGPISTLVFDAAGDLYGTTSEGGAAGCSCGTIFKLTPGGHGNWKTSVPYRFKGVPDSGFAYNGMATDAAGNFYGTTVRGGADNEGAVFQFTP